jgi:uncharacterized membrane protein
MSTDPASARTACDELHSPPMWSFTTRQWKTSGATSSSSVATTVGSVIPRTVSPFTSAGRVRAGRRGFALGPRPGTSAAMAVAHETGARTARQGAVRADEAVSRPRLPGILLGIGLGGFVDGIVLHQILQWHHMLTGEGSHPATTVAGLETNTLWDGLFHATTWVAVAAGIWILWRRTADWRWAVSGRAFVGWLLVGWGLFNVVEGIVDHHVLGIHHVREGANETAWDLAFLAFGALLVAGGWLLARSEERRLAELR